MQLVKQQPETHGAFICRHIHPPGGFFCLAAGRRGFFLGLLLDSFQLGRMGFGSIFGSLLCRFQLFAGILGCFHSFVTLFLVQFCHLGVRLMQAVHFCLYLGADFFPQGIHVHFFGLGIRHRLLILQQA